MSTSPYTTPVVRRKSWLPALSARANGALSGRATLSAVLHLITPGPELERAPYLCDADERVLDETMVHSLDRKADLVPGAYSAFVEDLTPVAHDLRAFPTDRLEPAHLIGRGGAEPGRGGFKKIDRRFNDFFENLQSPRDLHCTTTDAMAWARVADAGKAAAEATFDSLAPAEEAGWQARAHLRADGSAGGTRSRSGWRTGTHIQQQQWRQRQQQWQQQLQQRRWT
jgi:hypothetical protein